MLFRAGQRAPPIHGVPPPALRAAGLVFAVASVLYPQNQPAAQESGFQSGFHQALRISVSKDAPTTFRLKIPIGRSGNRLRVTFKAGEGSLRLYAANVALAGTGGALKSDLVPLSFGGSRSTSIAAWQLGTSDPVNLQVSFGQELYVSFEADGAMAASFINAFPDSYIWSGRYSDQKNPPAGTPWMRMTGLNTIEVEGPLTRAFVAIGDSITEGYVSGNVGDYVAYHDDYRNAWPTVAQSLLGLPFANGAISGQGIKDALRELPNDVLVLQKISDCVVLIGTNDLHAMSPADLEQRLTELFGRLQPFCRVWAGTLLPKEVGGVEPSRRVQVNDWIRRQSPAAAVVDFESVLAAAGDVNRFGPGLGQDGIHPTIAGQRLMGQEAARALPPPRLETLSPTSGPTDGGTVVNLSGQGVKTGAAVSFGKVPVAQLEIVSSSSIRVVTPPHDPGMIDVVLSNRDGQLSSLPNAFRYESPPGTPGPNPDRPPAGQSVTKTGCSATGHAALFPLILVGLALGIWATKKNRLR